MESFDNGMAEPAPVPCRNHREEGGAGELALLLMEMDGKDCSSAYKSLLKLEAISDATGLLYPYTERFLTMTGDGRYVIRVRGFRLFCKQAKWDRDKLLDAGMAQALGILRDEKPTAVRQALSALGDVVRYKPALRPLITAAAAAIDFAVYKESMQGLIVKDVRALLALAEAERAKEEK